MPALRCLIHEKINGFDADVWDDIVRASRSDILMSHEFVATVEEAFDDQARFAHAVIYDDRRPVACGSLCAFPIDVSLLADGSTRRITEIISKPVPSLLRRTIVFCGLPVSVGARHLAIAPGAPHQDVLRIMHEHAVSFAQRERAPLYRFQGILAPRSTGDGIPATIRLPPFLIAGDEHVRSPVFRHRVIYRRPSEPVSTVRAQVAGQIARRGSAVRTTRRHGRHCPPV